MHEMSLAAEIVRLCAERAAAEGAVRVVSVGLALGRLGHVEPEALTFCLGSAARGTPLDGARFDLALKDGRAWCFDCGTEVALGARGAPCPACGGHALRLIAGEELNVTTMEIA